MSLKRGSSYPQAFTSQIYNVLTTAQPRCLSLIEDIPHSRLKGATRELAAADNGSRPTGKRGQRKVAKVARSITNRYCRKFAEARGHCRWPAPST
jgi:hypothetical protein